MQAIWKEEYVSHKETTAEVEALLRSYEVLKTGHFVTGEMTLHEQHMGIYVNPRAIFREYDLGWKVVQALLDNITLDIRAQVDVVAGPATCGVILARDLSGLISSNRKRGEKSVQTVFLSQHPDDLYELHESDYPTIRDKRVLLVDDVRLTGRSQAVCAQRIKDAGGRVIATAEIVDRGVRAVMPIPFVGANNFFVIRLPEDPLYSPADCPMCWKEIPIRRF